MGGDYKQSLTEAWLPYPPRSDGIKCSRYLKKLTIVFRIVVTYEQGMNKKQNSSLLLHAI